MNYIEDEYDGAAPSCSPREAVLGEEDMQLMWKLFDFVLGPADIGEKAMSPIERPSMADMESVRNGMEVCD